MPPIGSIATISRPAPGRRGEALAFAREYGIVATSELNHIGVSRQIINRMRERGLHIRMRYGVYAAPSAL